MVAAYGITFKPAQDGSWVYVNQAGKCTGRHAFGPKKFKDVHEPYDEETQHRCQAKMFSLLIGTGQRSSLLCIRYSYPCVNF